MARILPFSRIPFNHVSGRCSQLSLEECIPHRSTLSLFGRLPVAPHRPSSPCRNRGLLDRRRCRRIGGQILHDRQYNLARRGSRQGAPGSQRQSRLRIRRIRGADERPLFRGIENAGKRRTQRSREVESLPDSVCSPGLDGGCRFGAGAR